MNKFVVDTSAWIEYLEGTDKGTVVREWIERPDTALLTTGLIIAEVIAKLLKEKKDAGQAFGALQALARIVPFDAQLGREAAEVYARHRKAKGKFGLADAHVVAAARLHGAKVLTCDNDFAGISEAIVLR